MTQQSGGIDAKIFGNWIVKNTEIEYGPAVSEYTFNADGTFLYKWTYIGSETFTGKYSASGGKITFTGIKSQLTGANGGSYDGVSWDKVVADYEYGTVGGAEYLKITQLDYDDNPTAYDLTNAATFARDGATGSAPAQNTMQPTTAPQPTQNNSSSATQNLVGEYHYGDVTNGYFAGSSTENWIYNTAVAGSLAETYIFNADGTYVYASFINANVAKRRWFETGTWTIKADNTVLFSNRNVTINDLRYPANSKENSKEADMYIYYVSATSSTGEKGIRISNSSTGSVEKAKTADFYKKS
jgi:hypothetical protein